MRVFYFQKEHTKNFSDLFKRGEAEQFFIIIMKKQTKQQNSEQAENKFPSAFPKTIKKTTKRKTTP